MKKQLAYLAACSCLLLGAACTNDDVIDTPTAPEKENGISYVTATIGDGVNTRLSHGQVAGGGLKVNWKASGEQFYGMASMNSQFDGYTFTQTGSLSEDNKKCNFNSSMGISPYQTFHLLYPAKDSYSSIFGQQGIDRYTAVVVPLPLTNQTGTLSELELFNYMTCITGAANDSFDSNINGVSMSVKFKHRISIIRLPKGMQFTGLSGSSLTATAISIGGTGIYSSGKLSINQSNSYGSQDAITFDGLTEAAITTTGTFNITADGKLDADVYIAILPNAASNGQDITISAKVGSDTYELVKTAPAAGFAEGEMYTLSGSMTKKEMSYTLVSFSATNVPTGDVWVITDENAAYSNSFTNLCEAIAAAGRNISLKFPNLSKLPNYAFWSYVHDGVENLNNLVSISLPVATEIGISALNRCANLTTVNFPEVTILETNALKNSGITSISLPKIEYIYAEPFNGCASLKTVALGTENPDPLLLVKHEIFNSFIPESQITLTLGAAEYNATVDNGTWTPTNPDATVSYSGFINIIKAASVTP